MKFINNFQCLMGGNGEFQHTSSLVLVDNITKDQRTCANDPKKKKKKNKKNDDGKVVKVVQPDGEIKMYDKPIRVSEVMTEEYLVCRSDSFYIGHKIPSLSQHDRLQLGHVYFLLPTHLFHSVLSFVTVASFAGGSSQRQKKEEDEMKAAFLKKVAKSSCPPFDIHKTPSGSLKIRVSDQFISQLMITKEQEPVHDDTHLLCTTPVLHREYKQLVVASRRGWKPKLEIIKETTPNGKRKVKLLLSASINRIKKQMRNNHQKPSSTRTSQKKYTKKKKKTTTKKTSKPVVAMAPTPLQTVSTSSQAIKSSKSNIKALDKNKT